MNIFEEIKNNNLSRVKYLIDSGVNINTKDINNNNTPLIIASCCGYFKIVKYFIKNGTNVNVKNKYNDTPLLWTSYNGHFKIVKYLVDNLADINTKNNNNNTPLSFSSYYGRFKIIKYLIKNGAEIDFKLNYKSKITIWLNHYVNKLYFYYLNQYFDKYTTSTMLKF